MKREGPRNDVHPGSQTKLFLQLFSIPSRVVSHFISKDETRYSSYVGFCVYHHILIYIFSSGVVMEYLIFPETVSQFASSRMRREGSRRLRKRKEGGKLIIRFLIESGSGRGNKKSCLFFVICMGTLGCKW